MSVGAIPPLAEFDTLDGISTPPQNLFLMVAIPPSAKFDYIKIILPASPEESEPNAGYTYTATHIS